MTETGQDVESRIGDEVREGWKQESDKLLPEVHAFDGASALMKALHERGWRVGLATSGKPELLEHLDQTPLAHPAKGPRPQ